MSAFRTDARCKSIAEYRRIRDRCYGTVAGDDGANLCCPRASEPGGHETAQAMPTYRTTTDPILEYDRGAGDSDRRTM